MGNEFRGDDAAGLIVAERLRDKYPKNSDIRYCQRDGSALILLWEGYKNVILIDTVCSGASPGTIHILDLKNSDCEEDKFRTSGHSFSIYETVKLAGYINKSPDYIKLFGIEGTQFDMGEGLSKDVENSIEEVVELISREIHFYLRKV